MEFKKWNGFFTVEASYIMPMVLFLYLAILSSALLLYNRCLVSQDCFLVGMRAAGFSKAEENYGEVIYGEHQGLLSKEDYVRERLFRKAVFYPGYELKKVECLVGEEQVIVRCSGRYTEVTEKRIGRINPVTIIREGRKK